MQTGVEFVVSDRNAGAGAMLATMTARGALREETGGCADELR